MEDLVADITAPLLLGSFEPDEGLAQLLAQTGLESQISPMGVVMILKKVADKKASKTLCLASVFSVCVLSQANAQAPQRLEQMIVTATKRAQDIQSVPASISAFSGDALDNRQIKTISDLTSIAPNVTFANQTGTGVYAIAIRGISTDQVGASAEQPIALHIDGVYQPRTLSLHMVLSDLDSIEVLRGPQGTLYGRNATGGVMNFITKKPTDVFEASATIFGGNYSRYGARAYVSGPIIDGISARVSAMVDRRDGWGKNLHLGTKVDASYIYGGKVAIRLQPTEDVTADINFTRTVKHTTAPTYLVSPALGKGATDRFGNYTPGIIGNILAIRNLGGDITHTTAPLKIYEEFDPEQTTVFNSATAIVNWEITPNVALKSISGWQRSSFKSYMPSDGMVYAFGVSSVNNNYPGSPYDGYTTSRTFSQEFNLNAKLWDRLDAVLGLYYLNDVIKSAGATSIYATAPRFFVALAGIGEQAVKSKAAFADVTFSVTDELRLLAGIRRTLDYNDSIQTIRTTSLTQQLLANCGTAPVNQPAFNDLPDLDAHATTYKAGVQYDFTPDIMGYVQWQSGFKAGGYNFSVCDNGFKPEQIYSWEAGIKTTLFNGTTTLNLSVFDYRYSNIQIARTIPAAPPARPAASSLVDNVGSAKIRGLEAELNTYLTDDLRFDAGVGILDSEYGSLITVNPSIVGNPVVDIAGNQLARAPNLTLNAGLEYTMRIGDLGSLTSRGEYSYSSRIWYSAFNEDMSHQDGYSLWNAIFTFTPDDCDLVFQAYVRNLTNKHYRQGGFPSATFWSARSGWNPPRTFGGEITAKF